MILQPKDLVLVDSREIYAFDFPEGLNQLSVQMPIDWLQRWLPEPSLVLGILVSPHSPWSGVLCAFKAAFTPEFAADPDVPATLRQDHLGLLINVAFAPHAATARVALTAKARRDTHARCVSLMRECLSKSGLAGHDVALAGAVSLRSSHRAFTAEVQTFAGTPRELCLLEARRLLSNRRFNRLTIAEVGQRCGYIDGSHFARQFRQVLEMSPSAFRG